MSVEVYLIIHRHIHVTNISIFEWPHIRNTVTNTLVNRGTNCASDGSEDEGMSKRERYKGSRPDFLNPL